MSQVHFDIETIIDRSFKQKGTVSIDRERQMITIRPLHSRRTYEIPLAEAVTMLVQRAIKQQVAENAPMRRRPRLVKRGLLSAGLR